MTPEPPPKPIWQELWFGLLLAVPVLFAGASTWFALLIVSILVASGAALRWIETRATPRHRNYLRCALAIFLTAWLFIGLPMRLGSGLLIGAILWGSISAALLGWCFYYERIERR